MNYNIIKHIGTLSDGNITTELNVSSNGTDAKHNMTLDAGLLMKQGSGHH